MEWTRTDGGTLKKLELGKLLDVKPLSEEEIERNRHPIDSQPGTMQPQVVTGSNGSNTWTASGAVTTIIAGIYSPTSTGSTIIIPTVTPNSVLATGYWYP